MAYVLETITQEDQEKILKDAECDPKKHQVLVARPLLKYNPKATWAIDRDRDIYFYNISGESENRGFISYLFYKNSIYEIELEGGLDGRLVRFSDDHHPMCPLLNILQQEVRDAYSVYGRFGSGDGNGDWMLKVDAIFEEME